jgi:acyl-CoA thioesterase FadM
MLDFFRLLALSLGRRRRKLRPPLETSVLTFRVWPGDLDLNLHLNNARYLGFMDLGRVEVMMAAGLGFWGRRGRQPLVAASFCRYFKPLGPFQSFELRTRLAAYDDKWFYFEQRFLRRGVLHALAAVKGLMLGPRGPIPPRELFSEAGGEVPPSPPLPPWMRDWLRSERAAIDHLKAEAGRPA